MNNNLDIRFNEGIKCAREIESIFRDMTGILDTLDEKINNMTWSGSKAQEFKTTVTNAKEELDTIYKTHISQIPQAVENNIKNYQAVEQ